MERACGEGAHEIQPVVLFESEDLYDWCQRHALPAGTSCLFSCFHIREHATCKVFLHQHEDPPASDQWHFTLHATDLASTT